MFRFEGTLFGHTDYSFTKFFAQIAVFVPLLDRFFHCFCAKKCLIQLDYDFVISWEVFMYGYLLHVYA